MKNLRNFYGFMMLFLFMLASTRIFAITPNLSVSAGKKVYANYSWTPGDYQSLTSGNLGSSYMVYYDVTNTKPVWIAIDIGVGPTRVMFSWNTRGNYGYKNTTYGTPGDYDVQVSPDSTNGTNGTWVTRVSIRSNNTYAPREHSIDFTGMKMIRMYIYNASTACKQNWWGYINMNLIDVLDISAQAPDQDLWFFMGDSIVGFWAARTPQDGASYQQRISLSNNGTFYPGEIDGSMPGNTALGGVSFITQFLQLNPDFKYWAVCWGANDSVNNNTATNTYRNLMQMQIDLLKSYGKIPVIPRICYASDGNHQHIPWFNKVVDDLTIKNNLPPGPDIWTWFSNHPDELIDGLHPNQLGMTNYNRLWAEAMLPLYRSGFKITNLAVTPQTITNNFPHVVTFSLKVVPKTGMITNVSLNLMPLGGSGNTSMTNISGSTQFRLSYTVPAGTSAGIKTLLIMIRANNGAMNSSKNFQVTVIVIPKLTVTNFTVVPGIITNNITQSVQFNLKAVSATGTVTNVSLDLTSLGGTVLKMNNISGATSYQYSYNVPVGFPAVNNQGLPTVVYDTTGFQNNRTNFHLTIRQGILVTNFSVIPGAITNNTGHVIVFNMKAKSGVGSITSVSLDLSQANGPAGVNMTNISGATLFRYAFAAAIGLSPGIKNMPITAFDSTGKKKSRTNFQLTVIGGLTVSNLTTAPSTITNDAIHMVVFNLKAVSRVGTVTNVSLNLSQLGGPASVKMTNISGATLFRCSFIAGIGIAPGNRSISVHAYDNAGIQDTGNNFLLNIVLPSKMFVTNFIVLPGALTNNISCVVVFSVKSKSTLGSVTNVALNLASLGGSSSVKMTNISGDTQWRYGYRVGAGGSTGLKSVFVMGKDSLGNSDIASNALIILAPPPPPVIEMNTFQVSPNPLILSGSSENAPMTIIYNATKGGAVTFEVFSLTGSEVKMLLGNKAKSILWNGTNDKGLTVASGIYYLIMKVDGVVKGKPLKIGVLK